jgi:hypothetical protein
MHRVLSADPETGAIVVAPAKNGQTGEPAILALEVHAVLAGEPPAP